MLLLLHGAPWRLRIFYRSSLHQELGPRTILRQVVRRVIRIRRVPPARLVHGGFHGVFHGFLPVLFLAPGFLFYPLLLRTRPWLRSGFLSLTAAGIEIFLHGSNLLRCISSIREIFPSFVVPVIPVLLLMRIRLLRLSLHCRLHWVSQCIAVFHTYHLC